MALDIWPVNLHVYQGLSWYFKGGIFSGGSSIAGLPPTDYSLSGGPYWAADFDSMVINELRRAHYHQWEGILEQGANPVIVECRQYDKDQPWFSDEERILSRNANTPFSSGATFSSGAGFSIRMIDIALQGDIALRRTVFNVNLNHCRVGGLIGGERFTIVHPTWGPRMYLVVRAYPPSGIGQQIEIRPPLREAALRVSTVMDFDSPRVVMKLANQNGEMAAKFDLQGQARPNLTFTEYGTKVVLS